jgi:hypothetical protein
MATPSVQLKLDAVDTMLERSLPLLNDLSSSAFFVGSGDLQYSKHKAIIHELQTWIAQNQGILPDWVIDPVANLNYRIAEWASEQGRSATPQNFAQDSTDSFFEVNQTLEKYKGQLLQEMDTSDEKVRLAVAKQMKSPWGSGRFYLLAGLVALATLAVIANVISPWLLPLVVIGALAFLVVIGALQLRQDDRLSQKNFLELIRLAFGSLPLLVKRRVGE